MTTFVRRIPAEFDTTYWRVAEGYMERELGAVSPVEAERHDKPRGFASVAGKIEGQRKDQGYCFAPYDGLRGLGMPDFHEDVDAAQTAAHIVEHVDSLRRRGAFGEPPASSSSPPAESPALRAIPYVIAAVGLIWLFNKTAMETAPPRPAR